MATRKKAEGIELLKPKIDPGSIQEITMLDWFAGFCMLSNGISDDPKQAAKDCYDQAEEMMKERALRMP